MDEYNRVLGNVLSIEGRGVVVVVGKTNAIVVEAVIELNVIALKICGNDSCVMIR
jgi:hypothetical protein